MRKWILAVYTISFLVPLPTHAKTSNCIISVASERNSGEKIRVNFKSTLHTKEECKALAEMHYPNFNPDQTKSKTVTYRWQGSPAPNSIAVTRRHKRKSKSAR